MIHFVTGRIGGGKSYFTVGQIIEELRRSDRFIVTNVRLRLDELEAYMQREFGENTKGEPGEPWTARVRLLTDLEAKRFWLYPAPGSDITERVQEGASEKGEPLIDFPKWDQFKAPMERGTFFVIDEVHDHFNAREWQKNHKDGIYWASKHRHLRQDALLVTQHPELCDKNFRRLSQDFTVLRNFGNEPLLGFRFAGRFRRATYLNEKKPGDKQDSLDKGWFKFDSKIAACYFTHGTTGIVSRMDVKESKGKGRSPWWLLVYVAVFAAALWYVPGLLSGGFTKAVGFVLGGKKEAVKAVPSVMSDAEAAAIVADLSRTVAPAVEAAPAAPEPVGPVLERPMIRMVQVGRNGFVTVTLTNGLQVTSADGVQLLGREGFRYQGRIYPMP